MKIRTTPFALASAAALALCAQPARAWDEDTCAEYDAASTADAGTGAGRDPYCANPQPLLGSNAAIAWDHSTVHWEFTYVMARCVGIDDAEAARLAAADEATDMSSPACGSKAANVGTGADADQYYREGYACGYEIGTRGDAGASAVPPYNGMLRWSQTDRCRRTTARNDSLLGHSEFFHYPYWSTTSGSVTTTALDRLSGWASGQRADLIDPAGTSCDMAASDAGVAPCTAPTVSSYTEYGTDASVCRTASGSPSPNEGWRMPRSTETGDERAFRTGIYLHSLGDSYSHFTCQWFSGQTVDTATWRVTVPTTSGPTDHTSYASGSFAYRCNRSPLPVVTLPDGMPHPVTTEECNAVCDLGQHDLEFGSFDTSNPSTSTAVQAVRNASVQGLTAVWDALATYAGRSARDDAPRSQATAYRYNIPRNFNAYYDGASRQSYARALVRSGAEQPCTCPRGVYDWVPSGVDASGARTGGYCETLTALAFSTSSTGSPLVTAATLARSATARYYAVGTFRRSSGATSTRVISDQVTWTATGAATVSDTPGATIGTVTPTASGAATIEVKRLGVSARLAVTVTP